jgi:hypothetical protein
MLVAIVAGLTLCGCRSTEQRSVASDESTAPASHVADIASSDPQVLFFHEQLVANADDVQSEFGTHLSTLGMSPRDLLQDDPKHAYDTVLAKVRSVEDATLRGQMLRTFFNLADR